VTIRCILLAMMKSKQHGSNTALSHVNLIVHS